jgi:hypothetical protein
MVLVVATFTFATGSETLCPPAVVTPMAVIFTALIPAPRSIAPAFFTFFAFTCPGTVVPTSRTVCTYKRY